MKKLFLYSAILCAVNNFIPLFAAEEPIIPATGHIVFSSKGNEARDRQNKITFQANFSRLQQAHDFTPLASFIDMLAMQLYVPNPETRYARAISTSMEQGNITFEQFPQQKLIDYQEIITQAQKKVHTADDAKFLTQITRSVHAELEKRDREIYTYASSLAGKTDQQLQDQFTILEANIHQISRAIANHETSKNPLQAQLKRINEELDKYDKSWGLTNLIHDNWPWSAHSRADLLETKQKLETQIKRYIKAQFELTTQLEQNTHKYERVYQKMLLHQYLNDSAVGPKFREARMAALEDTYRQLGHTTPTTFTIDAPTTQYLKDQGFDTDSAKGNFNFLRNFDGTPLTKRFIGENLAMINFCAQECQIHPEAKQLLDLATTVSVASSEAAKACNFPLAAGLHRCARILYCSYKAVSGVVRGAYFDQLFSLYTLTHHIGLRYIEEIRFELQGSTPLTAFGAVARGTGYATEMLLDEAFQETSSIIGMADDAMDFISDLSSGNSSAWHQLNDAYTNFCKLPPEEMIGTASEIFGMLFGGRITKALSKIQRINRIVTLMHEWNPISVAGRMLACPEERKKELEKLTNLLLNGVVKDGRIEAMLDADSKIIYRKDFGKHALSARRGYPKNVNIDHYNIEIQVRRHPNVEAWDTVKTYHIVVDANDKITDFY